MARTSPVNKGASSFPKDTFQVATLWDTPMPLLISLKKRIIPRQTQGPNTLKSFSNTNFRYVVPLATLAIFIILLFLKIILGPEIWILVNRKWEICKKKERKSQIQCSVEVWRSHEKLTSKWREGENVSIINYFKWRLQKPKICLLVLIINSFK